MPYKENLPYKKRLRRLNREHKVKRFFKEAVVTLFFLIGLIGISFTLMYFFFITVKELLSL